MVKGHYIRDDGLFIWVLCKHVCTTREEDRIKRDTFHALVPPRLKARPAAGESVTHLQGPAAWSRPVSAPPR